MSEKDEISLIMECDYPSSSKLRMLREERSQESSDSNSHFGIKVVQDKLRHMLSSYCMMLDLFLVLNTCDFENCKHTLQMTNEQLPPIRVTQNHYMGKIQILSVFIDVFQFHISSGIEGSVVKHHHDFFKEIIDLYRRLELSCNQNFDWCIVLKYIVELVEHGLIVFLNKLLTSFLLVLNSDRSLTLFSRQFLSFLSLLHLNLVLHDISLIVYFNSLLLIFYFVRLLLKSSCKLLHIFRALFDWFSLRLGTHLLFMRFIFDFFCHC